MLHQPAVGAVAGPIVPHPPVHRLVRPQGDPRRSTLHKAASSGNFDAFNRIARHLGPFISNHYANSVDSLGRTILMEICRSGDYKALSYLFQESERVDIYLQDNEEILH